MHRHLYILICYKGNTMRQKGNAIVGDPVRVERYTSDWMKINLHPSVFYRHIDKFERGFSKVKGLYAEIDNGSFVSIRFSDKDDLTEFHRMHHEYL